MGRLKGWGIGLACLLAAAPAAQAATVQAGGSPRFGHWIDISAPPGQTNTILLARVSQTLYQPPVGPTTIQLDGMVDIVDLTADVTVGGTCVKLTRRSARCPSGDVTAHLGDGNDEFHTPPLLNQNARAFGGPGNDVLQAEHDLHSELHGGPGNDRLLLAARSGWQYFSCGDGADSVLRDDLALHLDSLEPATACETNTVLP